MIQSMLSMNSKWKSAAKEKYGKRIRKTWVVNLVLKGVRNTSVNDRLISKRLDARL